MKHLTALLTGILIGAPLLAEKLIAAEWDTGAGLSLGAEFSDNICLRENNKKARGFATVTPDIHVRGRGARTNVSLSGNLRYNTLADSDFSCSGGQGSNYSNRESVIPSVRYRGDLELIDNWLTLESDASASTSNIDPFAPGNSDSFDGRDNVNIVYQYGAGARIQGRLFDRADMRLRYNYNEQHNAVRVLGDSSENRGEFDLGTERSGDRLTVGLSGRYSQVTYDGTVSSPAFDNTLSSAQARASLRMSPDWRVSVMGGEEWNEFISLRPEIDGTYWDASLRWSPNDRVDAEVGTGERFFGTTPRMSIRYNHKRSELSATYNRTLTLPRNLRSTDGFFDTPFDPGFDTEFDPGDVAAPGQFPGLPPTLSGEPTFIGDSPIINERLRLAYRYSGRRTMISVSASESRQQRLEDLDKATFSTLGFALSRSLSAALTANLNLTLTEREGQGVNVSVFSEPTQTWRALVGLNRRLGSRTTMSMSYQHTRRESNAAFNSYTENRVVLSARHQF